MRLMVSAGGTGGHIYPALAAVDAVRRQEPDTEVLYIGSERGLEKSIVPQRGIEFKALEIQGFRRKLSFDNVKTMYLFLKSVGEAKKIIKEFNPDVVVGFGGYVSGAVVYAAHRMGIPTVIHEQNSVVGMTNKFLSHGVDEIGIAFEAARSQFPTDKVTMVGNPRAQEVAHMHSHFEWREYGLRNDKPTLLIFGGSQGALKINKATIEAIPAFNERDYQVVFVTGQKRYDDVLSELSEAHILVSENIVIKPYISNMPEVMPRVAVILGRAGATSIAEITALGVPSILVPSPYVTADHQTKNAQSLVNAGAAEMIVEADLTGEKLVAVVDDLMNDDVKRLEMEQASKKLGVLDAADQLVALMRKAMADRNTK
ncbi:undecaprenyldiphospho-muramoylpentapeptide beta-N-acetylglucosaminyltransferase [Periweissella cryptocerci]|uniref:UDP-N-acetylglucosamine--N-acetylmuramyl-(pentapeptide) pyrophosphoryl-undecaprenol N-acetylglucosamine transferase n=1 Tax=Periweissella cryptocerci TaxID=2506420 RepID=A0A4P6YS16_9LACO|nr:undecaprenyldiphospho-muramoylpentapeptide beta-N-acetylglucosaminyltransferase [Periweissella cryptocerci]QBO35441.1 undecaprenyldiphospho-muramoylpentapeptide beta-N-acetylglucosaminyltransferase [Periweissella cryptocerci]